MLFSIFTENPYITGTSGDGTTGDMANSNSGGITDTTIGLIVGVVLIFLLGMAAFICLIKKRKAHTPPGIIELSEVDIDPGVEVIPTGSIILKKLLGKGSFGEVYQGDWNGTMVAMKRLQDTNKSKEFASEANMLWSIHHPHIVRMLGFYTLNDGDCFMVLAFAEKGSLLEFLQRNTIGLDIQLQMIGQIIKALRYLQEKKIVHRDIAARNILVDKAECMIISDLGMSRTEDYYASKDTKMPIRWCAPESLKFHQFSHKSDVWSFGVLMWEIFTHGAVPYNEIPNNKEVVTEVLNGKRLKQPPDCPDEIYHIMQSCWTEKPEDRPPLVFIFEKLHLTPEENSVQFEGSPSAVQFYEKTPARKIPYYADTRVSPNIA